LLPASTLWPWSLPPSVTDVPELELPESELVELVELEVLESDVLESEVLESDVPAVEVVDVEPVPVGSTVEVFEVVDVSFVEVDVASAAVCVTPAIRPTVTAVAPTEAATPARVDRRSSQVEGRLGPGRPFMPTTMCRRGSGPPYAFVKTVLMLAGASF
jgi:hypothetical protein